MVNTSDKHGITYVLQDLQYIIRPIGVRYPLFPCLPDIPQFLTFSHLREYPESIIRFPKHLRAVLRIPPRSLQTFLPGRPQ
jgi:hypothetical protein